MKNKYLGILLGMALMSASLGTTWTAYAEEAETKTDTVTETDTAAENNSEESNMVFGEVTSINTEEGTITLAITSQPEGDPAENEDADSQDREELVITVTEDTVITKMTWGGGQPGREIPEMPDGENSGGQAPEVPDGENSGGQALEMPDGENGGGQAPEMPDGESGGGQAPEMPDGENSGGQAPEMPDGENSGGQAPEMPDGENSGGQAPEMPDGEMPEGAGEEASLEDIQEGDRLLVTLDEGGNPLTIQIQSMEMGETPGKGPGQSAGVDSYSAVNEYTEDTTVSDAALESTGTDENTVLVSGGASVTFLNDVITRVSSDSTGGDNSSFYGVGAAVLATDGTAYVSGGTIDTDSQGGAGIFAYGNGTVYAMDTAVTTQQDTSGGIHAAGGGTLYAWDLNVETNGESSAAIRSDRGGGTMVVDGGSYTSNGVGSPAVYCTANIAVHNAALTASGSEAVCIEGLNSLRLYDCSLSGNMSDDSQNDTTWTIILYQSMSGDSEIGNSTFQMEDGTIDAQNGGVFYTTNTECTINLKNVAITYNDDSEFFLQCTGNNNQRGWGTSGANGSDCLFTADTQEMKGNVIWDTISNLDFYLTNGSSLEGAFINDETYAGENGTGFCNVWIDENSVWTVTGDSTVTSLSNAGTIADDEGNAVTIQGADGTVYQEGDSAYTITVDSYQSDADLSAAGSTHSWEEYAAERPEL